MDTDPGIRIGPAGWSYDDWKGVVYPKGMKDHPLLWMSSAFDVVEVNATFYRSLPANVTARWTTLVEGNPNFRFLAKLLREYTHEREEFPRGDVERGVRECVGPLVEAGRFGAMLVQFPWSFKRTPENRQWLARIADAFADLPLAVELRHSSWDDEEVYESMADRDIAFCNIDQPLFKRSMAPGAAVTAPVGYVRLHGRNANDWFRSEAGRDDRYDYLYSREELKPWVEKIQRMRKRVDDLFVITNNHYRGQAVVNAFDLQQALGQTSFDIPACLAEEYPHLKELLAG
jgi:uncharacterized protein YecE (DUF72 family)